MKTVNDLWKELEHETYEDSVPHVDMVKEALIEWIKEMDKEEWSEEFTELMQKIGVGNATHPVRKFIMYFNNLKEEDVQ